MGDFNFDQITDQIYVGSRFDPGDWFVLAALNITVDINLQVEAQDYFMRSAPEIYLWLPAADWYGPDSRTLRTGAHFIDLMVKEERNIYVHCQAGVGRSPAMVVAYLMLAGKTMQEALDFTRTKRPRTKLTDAQLQHLEEFEAELKRNSSQV